DLGPRPQVFRHEPKVAVRPTPSPIVDAVAETLPRIDLVSPESFAGGQPHDQFTWLRANEPVYRHPLDDGSFIWAITKHADVRAIGRDHQTFSNYLGGIHIDDIPEEGLASVRNMMLFMDPPEHHRYRKLVRDP